ncbi:hypothetical protein [Roseobacter sp.]|uniref:hypothetical protein n=1 Tax=Roseobacter sp. TaxID=1907202 RepID=UPI00385B7CCF
MANEVFHLLPCHAFGLSTDYSMNTSTVDHDVDGVDAVTIGVATECARRLLAIERQLAQIIEAARRC